MLKLCVCVHKEKAVSESLENHILMLFIWIDMRKEPLTNLRDISSLRLLDFL